MCFVLSEELASSFSLSYVPLLSSSPVFFFFLLAVKLVEMKKRSDEILTIKRRRESINLSFIQRRTLLLPFSEAVLFNLSLPPTQKLESTWQEHLFEKRLTTPSREGYVYISLETKSSR